jgi:D-glycero-alpha-D-manno-heptose 1-phosphate guanylyltransferase
MEIKQAIILAGGLGTRLRSVVPDMPKCMAFVAGRPFLYHVINYLRLQGIESFIFSLGYKHDIIEDYLKEEYATLQYQVVIEDEPLGTGGAIRLACQQSKYENVLVVNGDTLFRIDLASLAAFHLKRSSSCTLALKPMHNFDRYGVVETDAAGKVTEFREKQYYEQGLINGGVYLLNTRRFLEKHFEPKFSFEKEYLEKEYQQGSIYAMEQDEYFIDIGIPEDYERVQHELQRPALNLKNIDNSWTLFLDRDGVLNEDKVGSYIFHPDEYIFYKGVPPLFKSFNEKFARVIIATNQRGVGRNMMSLADLDAVHEKMLAAIRAEGGNIDAIFAGTSLHNDDLLRKPNPGMALKAKEQFPEIDFGKSIMIGNNISDMQFGRNCGMYTVFLKTTSPDLVLPHPDIDLAFNSLTEFAAAL